MCRHYRRLTLANRPYGSVFLSFPKKRQPWLFRRDILAAAGRGSLIAQRYLCAFDIAAVESDSDGLDSRNRVLMIWIGLNKHVENTVDT